MRCRAGEKIKEGSLVEIHHDSGEKVMVIFKEVKKVNPTIQRRNDRAYNLYTDRATYMEGKLFSVNHPERSEIQVESNEQINHILVWKPDLIDRIICASNKKLAFI